MKLTSTADFVIEESKKYRLCVSHDAFAFNKMVVNHAKFVKQTKNLGMFIPCNGGGQPLEEPNPEDYGFTHIAVNRYRIDLKLYQEAKERVLFKGDWVLKSSKKFPSIKWVEDKSKVYGSVLFYRPLIIEDLIKYNLDLTESAIKQIKK